MTNYPPFTAVKVSQVEHPTLMRRIPKSPTQVVFDMSDESAWEVVPLQYWEAETITVNTYEEIKEVVDVFDIMRCSDTVNIFLGDSSLIDREPVNPLATAIWALSGQYGNSAIGQPAPGVPQYPYLIHGPVLITGGADQEGNTTSVPRWVDRILARAMTRLNQEFDPYE